LEFNQINPKRLKYYYAKNHTSLYQARNLALKKSRGKFIAFLDTDDVWFKDKLSSQIKQIKNKKTALVYSNYYILNQVAGLKKIAYKDKLPEGIIYKELLKNYFLGIGTVLIKKDIFLKGKNLFNTRFSIIGDFDFFTRLSKVAHFACINRPLSIYRIHEENFSNKNYQMHIKELKFWIKKQKSFDNHLIYSVRQKILYMQIILNILNKKYILSVKKIQQISSVKIKVKLIIFLLIPNFIFKKLKKNFS
jgi:glycosyltransferase involved in cell wall biosynthesis